MLLVWTETSWEDYLYWQRIDRKIVLKINKLLKEIRRTPYEGAGSPEPLKHNWSGYWSRRITIEHRIVYKVENNRILIAQCRFHY